MTLRLYIHKPRVVLSGQVNQISFTYPISQVEVDNLNVGGAITDAKPGQTIVFGTQAGYSDRGVQRIRALGDGATLYFGRSSRGRNPTGGADGGRWGEVDLEDNLYFEVWDERRVWPKIPALLPDGDGVKIFKDGSIEVASFMSQPDPVANGGVGVAGTAGGAFNDLQFTFDAVGSIPVHTGATLTGYLWNLGDGSVSAGAPDAAVVTGAFPPGFRYVSLTVTDSSANTHTTWIPVYVDDPADSQLAQGAEVIDHTLTAHGAELTVRITEPLDALDYPDGTLVMLWEDEPSGPSDRSHMRFVGWHHHDPGDIQATRTATLGEVTFECLDVIGRLKLLPGFAQEVRNVETAFRWYEMENAHIDKYLVYLLYWHSTALEVAPFSWTGTGGTYAFTIIGSDSASLFEQVQRVAQAMIPPRHFTCDSQGRLQVLPDPMLQDVAQRTAVVQRDLTADQWSAVRAQHLRPPTVRTLRTGALLASATDTTPLFSLAPGDAPGLGAAEQDRESHAGLVPSQAILNNYTGHQYARLNANEGHFSVELASDGWPSIEPAHMSWVELTIPAGVTTPRLRAGTARTLPHSVTIRYDHARTATLRSVEVELELETSGQPGKTVVLEISGNPPPSEDEWWGGDDSYWEDNFPVEPGVPNYFYGEPMAYILWDGAHVFRTWDIMESSPTWELVDTGITGTIHDGQYVILSNTAGMWLLTSTAVWWCADIMADAPVWTAMLTLTTVQATDATPPSGAVEFKSMFQGEDSKPGFCIVATGWTAQSAAANYNHAYFWITHNYGASWTQVDMNAFLRNDFGVSRGYTLCGLHGLNMHRSSGVIFAMRGTPRVVSSGAFAVFVSEDYGATWTKRYEVEAVMTDTDSGALLDPFPDINDPSWLVRASTGQNILQRLYKSTDAWTNGALLALPTDYNCLTGRWRPNSRTFDPNHLIAWYRNEVTGKGDLLETNDGGANWSMQWASEINLSSGGNFALNTPNGWPPLPETWFVVRSIAVSGVPFIQVTEDHFQTFASRVGNLGALVGSVVNGDGSGFCLPKIGVNT